MDPFDNIYNMIDPLFDYDFPEDFAPINFNNEPEEKFEIQIPRAILVSPPKNYRPFKSFEQLEKDIQEINKQLNK